MFPSREVENISWDEIKPLLLPLMNDTVFAEVE